MRVRPARVVRRFKSVAECVSGPALACYSRQEMPRRDLTTILKAAVRERALISVERSFDPCRIAGYAVGIGSWLLLNLLNTDSIALNGYTAVRAHDLRRAVPLADEDEGFLVRAARLRKLRPRKPPGISLASTTELLRTAARSFPLVTIHREKSKRDREVCWIGIPERFTGRFVELREVTPAARFRDRTRRHPLAAITEIDFGGGYEAALVDVARQRGERI